MSNLECPSKTENDQCLIHDAHPDRFPKICAGPKQCFGKDAKKVLEAMQPTDECLFGVVKSKAFKDKSCSNCEYRGSIKCRWRDQDKRKLKEKTKFKKSARAEKKEEEKEKWRQATF